MNTITFIVLQIYNILGASVKNNFIKLIRNKFFIILNNKKSRIINLFKEFHN